jgi:hypothetical protein
MYGIRKIKFIGGWVGEKSGFNDCSAQSKNIINFIDSFGPGQPKVQSNRSVPQRLRK